MLSGNAQASTSQDFTTGVQEDSITEAKEDVVHVIKVDSTKPVSPTVKDAQSTPKTKKLCLTEIKKKNINNISASIIKRKNQKQINEDAITSKRIQILEAQHQCELIKLEKTKILLDLDIELKKVLLESAKLDLEIKKKNFNL